MLKATYLLLYICSFGGYLYRASGVNAQKYEYFIYWYSTSILAYRVLKHLWLELCIKFYQ